MSLNKLYNRQTWHNSTNPALNDTNLNIQSKAIDDIDDRIIDIAGTIMETVPQVQEDLAEAQELLEDAEAINSHPPIIGQNGNWWTWDTSTNAYVDSGVDASVTVSVNPNTETLPAGSNAYVQNVGTSTDPILKFGIPKGDKGDTGGATPGSDISNTVVNEITVSSDTYPEYDDTPPETVKAILGKIKKFLDDLKTKKADKVASATNNNLAALDANGNLKDSGKSSSAVIPSGGTTGQVLKKSSGTDYAVEWGNESGGGTPDYVDAQYSSTTTYTLGQTCIYGNKRYRSIYNGNNKNHTPPNANYWKEESVSDELKFHVGDTVDFAPDQNMIGYINKSNNTILIFIDLPKALGNDITGATLNTQPSSVNLVLNTALESEVGIAFISGTPTVSIYYKPLQLQLSIVYSNIQGYPSGSSWTPSKNKTLDLIRFNNATKFQITFT